MFFKRYSLLWQYVINYSLFLWSYFARLRKKQIQILVIVASLSREETDYVIQVFFLLNGVTTDFKSNKLCQFIWDNCLSHEDEIVISLWESCANIDILWVSTPLMNYIVWLWLYCFFPQQYDSSISPVDVIMQIATIRNYWKSQQNAFGFVRMWGDKTASSKRKTL